MEATGRAGSTPGPASARGGDWRHPGMLEVNVTTAADLAQALKEAIAAVAESAEHHGTGILVTRTGAGSYVVRAHPAVPSGFIRQQNA
ncbi:hypothetical protein LJR014_001863 [Arthrobacter sp. LjRoot14]